MHLKKILMKKALEVKFSSCEIGFIFEALGKSSLLKEVIELKRTSLYLRSKGWIKTDDNYFNPSEEIAKEWPDNFKKQPIYWEQAIFIQLLKELQDNLQ